MFLCVIKIENYYIFLTINFYIRGCLGEKKNTQKKFKKIKKKLWHMFHKTNYHIL